MKCKKCNAKLGRYASGPLCRRCKAPKTTKAAALQREEQARRRRSRIECKGKDCTEKISLRKRSGLCDDCLKKKQRRARYVTCKNPACTSKATVDNETGFCHKCWKETIFPKQKQEHFGMMKFWLTSAKNK